MYGSNVPINLSRDVEAAVIPIGTKVTLLKGEQAYITQSLGGSYTIVVNGNMFRIEGKDADALGKPAVEAVSAPANASDADIEKLVWGQLRTCYDPEIPVNIVDLGLVYECRVTELEDGGHRADVKLTLTAPGCGMGGVLAADAQGKISELAGVREANVEVVFEPPWNPSMMSEAARLELGMM